MNNLEPQFAFDNQKVEDALTRLAGEDNRRARHALYQAFLESILIVPMAENGNSATLEEIRLLQNSQGKKALAVFTSTSAWRCWKPQEKCWAAAKGSDLIDAARKMGAEAVVINIAGPGPKGFLTKSEIEIMRQAALSGKKLAEAADTRENSQELDLDVEQPPQNLSRELIGFLKINLDLQPQAQSAFLFQAAYNNGDPHLVLGVEAKDRDDELNRWLKTLNLPLAKYLSAGQYMDFMLLDHETAQKIGEIVPLLWARD